MNRPSASEIVKYRSLQAAAIRGVPEYPADTYAGTGIVTVAGGPRYYTCAWVLLSLLRDELGCRLPIEVWHLGPAEMSPEMARALQRFDVTVVNAEEVRRRHPARRLGGWEAKSFAILHSRFREVILIDAENVPLQDPAALVLAARFRATGALFWPDIRRLSPDNPIWEICDVPYRDEPEVESGQLVIDKQRCWRALCLARHLNDHSDFYFRFLLGDKETFHLAWRMLGQPFAMPPHAPVALTSADGFYYGGRPWPVGLNQHDFEGRVTFQHRTGAKWTAWGENPAFPGARFEAEARAALASLREVWDGRVGRLAPLTRPPRTVGDVGRVRFFRYYRIGSDERTLELRPDGTVGDGGGDLERRWRMSEHRGEPVLTISSDELDTCALRLDPDGVWRGRWMAFERMPVELVALGPDAPTGGSA